MGPRQQPRGLWIETTAGAHDGSASAYGPASGLRSASGLDLRSQRPEEAGSFRASPDLGPPRPKDAIHSRGLGSSLGAFGSRQSLGPTTDRRLLTDRSLEPPRQPRGASGTRQSLGPTTDRRRLTHQRLACERRLAWICAPRGGRVAWSAE